MARRLDPTAIDSPETSWRLHSWWERALIAVAMMAIVLPGLGTVAGVGLDGATPAEDATTVSSGGAGGLMGRVGAWASAFEDRFAFRGTLLRAQAWVRYVALGVSPQPEVIRGRDGWLFYADDGGLDDYLRAVPFSDDELRLWASTLQHTQDALAARGIVYLFVIAPDKHVLYPEQMPASLRPRPGPSRADQLFESLQATTSVHVLDLRPALLAAKASERIYHRTDTHWNDVGAGVASAAILGRLQALAPGIGWIGVPPRLERQARRERVTPGMDLAVALRLEGWLPETRLELVPSDQRQARVVEPATFDPDFGEPRLVTARPDGLGPRALVYRDSFGSALVPWLAESFGRATILWEYDVDLSTVDAERPAVVVHEWASRRLSTRLPYDFTQRPPAQQ